MTDKVDDLFNITISRFQHIYRDFLYKKSFSYLADIEVPSCDTTLILTPPQVGILYSIKKSVFIDSFDNSFLNKMGMFKDRISFIFKINRSLGRQPSNCSYKLMRVVIFGTSPEERSSIDEFMGNNLDRYPKFVKMTSNFDNVSPDEIFFDADLFREISSKPTQDKVKYKDIALIFE